MNERRANADTDALAREVREVLGGVPTQIARLGHSSVTRGVWRVESAGATAVVKVLAAPGPGAGPGAHDPASTSYWLREALVYAGGLPGPYRDAGVRCPALIRRVDRADGDVALWLEDVRGVPADRWTLDDFDRALRRLGRAQGAYLAGAPLPSAGWESRGFLRSYLFRRRAEYDVLLATDDAWRHPAIARHFDSGFRDELRRLRADRERLLGFVEAAPATFAHLDAWPDNLFDHGDELVLVDWGFAGIGSAGEDPGNLVPDSVFDLRHPASILRDLDGAVFTGYVAGLREAGWDGDERLIRLGMTATACKYDWIAGATLWRAAQGTETQPIYGGVRVEPDVLFGTRAEVLRLMLDWATEARGLAADLGLGGRESA